jgi:hypothetical protein
MTSLRVILSVAISAILLLADASPAPASTLDGKCCRWADHGNSYRYRAAVMKAQTPRTCSGYGSLCLWYSDQHGYGAYGTNICHAAKAQCLRTGIYVGPFSGRRSREMPKI